MIKGLCTWSYIGMSFVQLLCSPDLMNINCKTTSRFTVVSRAEVSAAAITKELLGGSPRPWLGSPICVEHSHLRPATNTASRATFPAFMPSFLALSGGALDLIVRGIVRYLF